MINETNDKIRYTSFTFFLEKGYEATNIRDICRIVGIKPSSLYFYYKSKQELFFSIYDEIWSRKIKFLENIKEIIISTSLELNFKKLYAATFDYNSKNILNEKLLLRYHLFPAEEISIFIKDKFNFWNNEEDRVLLNLINQNIGRNDININPNDFLQYYKRFLSLQILEMITNNIKPTLIEQDMLWSKFWNNYLHRTL